MALGVLCAAMFISAVDSTIVNVALPDIARGLDAQLGELQWVIDGFLVSLAGTLLVGSGLADRFGRRRVFLLGLVGFAATSVLAAVAQNIDELLARPTVAVGALVILAVYISVLGVMFLLPQYLHYVRHESTLVSGLVLAPLGIATLLAAPLSPRVEESFGSGWAIVAGLATMALGIGLLLLINRTGGVIFVLIGMALFGAMIPLTVTLVTGVVMKALGGAKAGDGGAINQLARHVGGSA